MNFQELQERFVAYLRERVRSGELTERGLARLTGVSQPHIHNVLKGKRLLSMGLCDEVLHALRVDLLDLMRPDEILNRRRRD